MCLKNGSKTGDGRGIASTHNGTTLPRTPLRIPKQHIHLTMASELNTLIRLFTCCIRSVDYLKIPSLYDRQQQLGDT